MCLGVEDLTYHLNNFRDSLRCCNNPFVVNIWDCASAQRFLLKSWKLFPPCNQFSICKVAIVRSFSLTPQDKCSSSELREMHQKLHCIVVALRKFKPLFKGSHFFPSLLNFTLWNRTNICSSKTFCAWLNHLIQCLIS